MYESYLIIVYAGSKTYQRDLKFEDFPSVVVSLVLSSLLSCCCCFSRPVAVSLLLSQRIFSSRRYSHPIVASLVLLLLLSSCRCFSRPVVVSLVLSTLLSYCCFVSCPVAVPPLPRHPTMRVFVECLKDICNEYIDTMRHIKQNKYRGKPRKPVPIPTIPDDFAMFKF